MEVKEKFGHMHKETKEANFSQENSIMCKGTIEIVNFTSALPLKKKGFPMTQETTLIRTTQGDITKINTVERTDGYRKNA